MTEQEKSIISGASEMFVKYGIRSVTMDDVARELAVSKKTLYKYVANKAELVDRFVRFAFEEVYGVVEEAIGKSSNAIDEMLAVNSSMSDALKAQHPAIEFQLKKYYPETWKWLADKQTEVMKYHLETNLVKGIEQGLYRQDLNIETIKHLYFAQFVAIHNDSIVPLTVCENPEFIKAHFEYHLRGVVSKKGLAYLEEKLEEHKSVVQ